jgi:hypothetical protein
MRRAVAAAGRDPAPIRVVGRLPLVPGGDGSLDADRLRSLVDVGVTDFTIARGSAGADGEDHLRAVVAAFHSAIDGSEPG